MEHFVKLYHVVIGILLITSLASLPVRAEVIEVRAAEVSAYPGEQVTVPVTVSNFQAISYFSITVEWDTTVVSNATVTAMPGLIVGFFDSRVHVYYDTSYPALALNDGAELFNITFTAIGAISQSTPIDVTIHSLLVNSVPTNDGLGVDGSVTISPQPVVLNVGSASGNVNDEVLIPLTVQNYTDVSLFDVTLEWDTTVVEYLGVENILPDFQTIEDSWNVYAMYVTVASTSLSDPNLADGTLLANLRFRLKLAGGLTGVTPVKNGLVVVSGAEQILQVNPGIITVNEVVPVTDTLIVQTNHLQAYPADIVNEYVTVTNFNSVTSFDILVEWDSTVVTLLQPSFLNAFQYTETNNSLRLFYSGPAISFPDDYQLIHLTFTVVGIPGQSTPVDISITNLTADSSPTTLAVDGSVTIIPEPVVPVADTLIVQAPHVFAYPAQTINVPVTVTNFNSVTQFDILVEWDTTVVSHVNVVPAFPDFTITNYDFNNGLSIIYPNGAPISIPDNRELFSITFETVGAVGQSSPVDITIVYLTADSAPVTLAIDGSVTIIPEPVILNVGNGYGNVNDEVLIPLTVENYTNVTLFEVPIQWDTTVVEFLGAEDILADFGIYTFSFNSVMIASNYSNIESSYPDGTLLANLRFRLKIAGGRSDITSSMGTDVDVSGIEWPLQVNTGSIIVNEVVPMVASEILAGAELPSPQVEERSSVSVFPNPTSDFIEVRITDKNTKVIIAIFDQHGNPVGTISEKSSENGTFQYDLRDLRKGTYILKMNEGKSQRMVRFIKE